MIVAIDFTGSNGEPHSPSSLHYMNESKPNQYQVAIEAIGQILLNYDSDKRIPAFGFGASLSFPKMTGISHCFPLSGDFKNVDSVGLQHMMSLYASSLKNLSLSGPTYFGPIIEHVSKMCRQCKATGQHIYQTLLILTDGQIDDMQKVVDLIIECA